VKGFYKYKVITIDASSSQAWADAWGSDLVVLTPEEEMRWKLEM
jgi:hypothetical protein